MYVGSYSFTASSKVHRWENKSTLTRISIFRERLVDTHYHTCLAIVASVSEFVSHTDVQTHVQQTTETNRNLEQDR